MSMRTRCIRRQILKEIIDKKEGMGDIMKASFFSMTEAVYSAGEGVKHTIMDNVGGGMEQIKGPAIAVPGLGPCP